MSTALPQHNFTQTLPNGTSFDLIHLEAGTFTMGAADDDPDAVDWSGEKGPHSVALDAFYLAKHPVTQALFKAVMDGFNPSEFIGDDRPVESVSWFDAAVFCNQLNEMTGLQPCYFADPDHRQLYGKTPKGYDLPNEGDVFIRPNTKGYHLPTEAEWEYAARGGPHWQDNFTYAGSNKLKEVGWYEKNSHQETKPVGLKQPNSLGLFDMSGNVWEWCQDWWDKGYYQQCVAKGTVKNPFGAAKGSDRVRRGGGWYHAPRGCRVACRNRWLPESRINSFGFRLCLAPSSVTGAGSSDLAL